MCIIVSLGFEIAMKLHGRDSENEDREAVIDLFQLVYRERPVANYWDWLNQSNPAGRSITRVVEHRGRIIGHAAAIPLQMKITHEFVGYLCVDGVIHPDYRRRGIMRTLLHEVTSEAARRGMTLGCVATQLGRPAQSLATQIGFTDVRAGRMKSYYLILNLVNILRTRNELSPSSKIGATIVRVTQRARKLGLVGNVKIKQVSGFDSSFDRLWELASHNYDSLLIKRSSAYLNWRYSLHPENEYLIWGAFEAGYLVGFLISRHHHDESSNIGFIVDVFGRSDVVSMLFSQVVTYFKEHHVEFVKCELSDCHPYAEYLRRVGLVGWSSNMGLQFFTQPPSIAEDQGWLVQKGNHMMSWGDVMLT